MTICDVILLTPNKHLYSIILFISRFRRFTNIYIFQDNLNNVANNMGGA